MKRKKYINREISWLAFNDRVLQEAEDNDVPLIERLRFLGIYSNNQDEFFRVRVATMRRVGRLGRQGLPDFDGANPLKLLDKIQKIVRRQQTRFDNIYLELLTELRKEGILIVNEKQLNISQGRFVAEYFLDNVRQRLFPIMLSRDKDFPMLRDTSIYLAIRLLSDNEQIPTRYSLIEIPDDVPRFLELPTRGKNRSIILIDDVIRFNLGNIFYMFEFDCAEAYTVKFTRDSELDIDNDVSLSFMVAIERSLKRRRLAEPVRFTYDEEMPQPFLDYLIAKMKLAEEDAIIPGARYHNFKDFMSFPALGRADLLSERPEPLSHPLLDHRRPVFDVLRERDILLYVPYQSFIHILDFLREAAINPAVTEIHMTLYRVASNSAVVRALINAARNGVKVTVVVELQARFDEEANIFWANRMQEEGVRVIFGVSNLKVHAKLALVRLQHGRRNEYFAIVGTGNFNENTARVYTDLFLMTADPEVNRELRRVFNFFESNYEVGKYKRLLVAPFYLRKRIVSMINREIRNAQAGRHAEILFKINNLVDRKLIKKLYQASRAGVKIRLIVRGICSLVPGVPGTSENIEVVSVVDKYLEHPRIFSFANGGHQEMYIGSADLMTRNLDYRVEVLVAIRDEEVKRVITDTMEFAWKDNVKARELSGDLQNPYRERREGEATLRSQVALYQYFRKYHETLKSGEGDPPDSGGGAGDNASGSGRSVPKRRQPKSTSR